MQRSLSSLPLCSSHQTKLSSAGFETVGDIRDVGIVELSKEANFTHSEALEILKVVRGSTSTNSSPSSGQPNKSRGATALEILRSEQELGHVVTFSSQIDSMLGGGVPVGKITEICGAPGLGKTQVGMQLAVDVRIPEVFGGVGGEAIYIDTEGSFVVERVADLSLAAAAHLNSVAETNDDKEMSSAANGFTLEHILSGIHYYRCHDYIQLVALVNILTDIVTSHPKVRLIVVDSIASPFRYGFQDMGLRNRILSGLSQNLIQLAVTRNIAVVLTNQMTTKLSSRQGANKSAQLIPALGESWGHASTIRVMLFWTNGVRQAMLYKSPNRKEETVSYQITKDGIRDTVEPQDPLLLDTQYPNSCADDLSHDFEFEDEDYSFDETLLDTHVDDNLDTVHQDSGHQNSKHGSLKRKLSDFSDDVVGSVFTAAAVVKDGMVPMTKRPHPEH